MQTVGGTGALKLAAELLVREAPQRTVWVATPTWPNHDPIFRGTGLRVRTFQHADDSGQAFDPDALEAALDEAEAGDVVVLHGCCHNPTGIDPDVDQWSRIGSLLARRNLLPIIDMAYHGLGGGLDQDRAGMLALMEQVPAGLIAYSCSKNFALYRDRVGALVVFGDKSGVELARSNLIAIARASYSMPPDHGASVVSLILQSAHLTGLWRRELDAMRLRVRQLREALATHGTAGGIDLGPLARQNGFFSVLPLSTAAIVGLREHFGIYMAPSGRVNIAGLRLEQVDTFVAGLRAVA